MADDFTMTSNVLDLIGKFQSVRAGMEGVGPELKKRVAQHIIDVLPTNMHWMNSGGVLENSFSFNGNYIESSVPYAHRREFSFKGPDSLNRMFPNDPAGWYMRDTLQQVTTDGTINTTFATIMSEVTGGGS